MNVKNCSTVADNPSSVTLVAHFSKIGGAGEKVTFDTPSNGSFTVNGAEPAEIELTGATTLELAATPSAGYRVLRWYAEDANASRSYFGALSATASYEAKSAVKVGVEFTNADYVLKKADGSVVPGTFAEAYAAAADGKDVVYLFKDYTVESDATLVLGLDKPCLYLAEGVTFAVEGTLTMRGTSAKTIDGEGTFALTQTLAQDDELLGTGAYKYQVTRNVGGASVSYANVGTGGNGGVNCKTTNAIALQGATGQAFAAYEGEGSPAAIVCTVDPTVSINHLTGIAGVYATLAEAIQAQNNPGQRTPPADTIVVLLKSASIAANEFPSSGPGVWWAHTASTGEYKPELQYGMRIDCAGFQCSVTCGMSNSSDTYLINGSLASMSTINNSRAYFIGCDMGTANINANASGYSARVEIYDCNGFAPQLTGAESIVANNGGFYYMAGGPYTLPSSAKNVRVMGGTFTSDPTGFLASDAYLAVEENGVWAVSEKPVASYDCFIGDESVAANQFATLAAAVAVADAGARIVVARDLALDGALTIDKDVTIELNGHTVSGSGSVTATGALKIEDSSNYSTGKGTFAPSIAVDGSLEVCYGAYPGDIAVNAGGSFLSHAGTFSGALSVADGATATVRGGSFAASVADYLDAGCWENLIGGQYCAGRRVSAKVGDVAKSGWEYAFDISALDDDFKADYLASDDRASYADAAAWYRHAEARAAIVPYGHFLVDCTIEFDQDVATGAIDFSYLIFSKPLDRDLSAGVTYRLLSTLVEETSDYSQISYSRFVAGDPMDALTVGLRQASGHDENAGTTCTIQMRLYTTSAPDCTSYYTLASRRVLLGVGDNQAIIRREDGVAFYATLADAVAAANAGETVEIVKAGEYSFPNVPNDITLSCSDGVIFNCEGSDSISSVPNGCTVIGGTFNMGQNNYHGWQHAGAMVFENSTFNGKFFGYANLTFTGCHFVQTAEDYCMWTYSSPRIDYINCTFDCKGKAVNVYWEQHEGPTEVTADGCTFNSSKENKPALKINSKYGAFVVATTANNTLSGFPRGISGYDDEPNEGDYAYIVTNAEFDEAGKLIGGDANREFPESIVGQYFAADLATVSNTEGETWKIGVKTEDETIITTKPQESKVEIPQDVEIATEVQQKIEQSTKVEGVKLSATESAQKPAGIVAVVEEAKKNTEFAAAVEAAAEVSVKVEVAVEPTEYDNTADKGKVAFKLTPKATVTVKQNETELKQVVEVTNDMIDQNQKIAVSIYTGFAPATILHKDDNGVLIESFSGDGIVYDETTGVATVKISHFSSLFVSQEEIDPYVEQGYTKVADGFYQNKATYGESTDFYITSKAGLEYFRDIVNSDDVAEVYRAQAFGAGMPDKTANYRFAGKTVNLLSDIDLGNVEWTPIGREKGADKEMFAGTFDGNNHVVSNLKTVYKTEGGKDQAGLFGYSGKALTIKNLTLKNVDITGFSYVGALISTASNENSKIINCHVIGSVSITAVSSYVGCLVGHGGCAEVSNCSVEATSGTGIHITGGGINAGGIYGYAANKPVEIKNCSVSGLSIKLDTNYVAGGIVGAVDGPATVSGCSVNNVTIECQRGPYLGYILGNIPSSKGFVAIADCTVANSTLVGHVDKFTNKEETYLVQSGVHDVPDAYYVGSGVSLDAAGKVIGGTFEHLPDAQVATGYEKVAQGTTPETWVVQLASRTITVTNTEEAQAALDSAKKGDTIVFAAGDYGTIYLRNAGDDANRILENVTLVAAENAEVTVGQIAYQKTDGKSLDIEKLVIDGFTFDEPEKSAVLFNVDGGHLLRVDGLTVQNCVKVGNNSKGTTYDNAAFIGGYYDGAMELGTKFAGDASLTCGYHDIKILNNEITNVYQPIKFPNNGPLYGLTVTGNTFTSCGDSNVMMLSSYNDGEFLISNNKLVGLNGRFIRATTSTANWTIKDNKLDKPVLYDDSGELDLVKISVLAATQGTAVTESGNDWPAGSLVNGTYIANGDPALLPVAKVGTMPYWTLAEAFAAAAEQTGTVEDPVAIQLMAVTIEEGMVKLPSTLKNVKMVGAANKATTIRNTKIMAHDGGQWDYENLTFEGVVCDNSQFVFTGWRSPDWCTAKNFAFIGNEFKNIVNADNDAAIHFNVGESEAVNGLRIEGNVIDSLSGSQNNGIYVTCLTGDFFVRNNTIANCSHREMNIGIITTDGIDDNVVIMDNLIYGNHAEMQIYGQGAATSDSVSWNVSYNILDNTSSVADTMCLYSTNPEKTTFDLDHNYYAKNPDMNPGSFYLNGSCTADNIASFGVYPYYAAYDREALEAGTKTVRESLYDLVEPAIDVAAVISADGTTTNKYATLQAAVDAANAGETIEMLCDATENTSIAIEKSLTIDLAGTTLTFAQYGNRIGDDAVVTFKDGDIAFAKGGTAPTSYKGAFYVRGELTLDTVGIAIENCADYGIDALFHLHASNEGEDDARLVTLNINDSDIKLIGTAEKPSINDVIQGYTQNGGAAEVRVNLTNTKVKSSYCGYFAQYVEQLTLDGSTVTVDHEQEIVANSSGVFTLVNGSSIAVDTCASHALTGLALVVNNGCTVDVKNAAYLGLNVNKNSAFKSGSMVSVSNCCMKTDNEAYAGKDIAIRSNGKLTIEAGAEIVCYGVATTVDGASINIAGGKFKEVRAGGTGTITLTGGIYSTEPTASYVDSHYVVVNNPDDATKAAYPWKVQEPTVTTKEDAPIVIDISGKTEDDPSTEAVEVPVTVTQELAKEILGAGADVTQPLTSDQVTTIVEKLETKGEDGMTGWQKYAAGFSQTDKHPLAPKGRGGEDGKLVLVTSLVAPKQLSVDTGVKVKYILKKGTNVSPTTGLPQTWTKEQELSTPEFPVDVTKLANETYWKIEVEYTATKTVETEVEPAN